MKRSKRIHRDGSSERARVESPDRAILAIDTGIVDEYVHGAKFGRNAANRAFHLDPIRDVGADRECDVAHVGNFGNGP
jgi:hypothetical protein